MVGPLKPGTKVQADVWRKGQMRSVTVTIGEFQDERMASNKPAVRGVGEATNSRLGIAVSDLTPEQKQQMRLNAGILVVDIRPGSRMDLRAGDIILAVTARGDTQDIRTVQQFNQLIAQLDGKTPATLLIRRSNVQIFVPIPFAAPTPR